MKLAKTVIGNREYSVRGDAERFSVHSQPINSKTGEPWQADKILSFHATRPAAMVAWLRATNEAKKATR